MLNRAYYLDALLGIWQETTWDDNIKIDLKDVCCEGVAEFI